MPPCFRQRDGVRHGKLAGDMSNGKDMVGSAATPNVFDFGGLSALKRQAKAGDPAANKVVARQFEALFLQMVLKSMREATPRDGLFDSDQSRMYESLLDQQLSQVMSGTGRGTGLAAMIEAQLSRQNLPPQPLGDMPLGGRTTPFMPLRRDSGLPLPAGSGQVPAPVAPGAAALGARVTSSAVDSATQRGFVDRLLPAASATEVATGIPAHFLVAQAALETGWGRSELRRADGSPSYNIFGIKAGADWRGASLEAGTTEYVGGVAQARVERFRAYSSYEEAFRDYAALLSASPRYAGLLGTQEADRFARGLQAAGYATDPQYAAKLERIIGGPALRKALTG